MRVRCCVCLGKGFLCAAITARNWGVGVCGGGGGGGGGVTRPLVQMHITDAHLIVTLAIQLLVTASGES